MAWDLNFIFSIPVVKWKLLNYTDSVEHEKEFIAEKLMSLNIQFITWKINANLRFKLAYYNKK